MALRQPHDPRWQGRQRNYLTVDILKNTVLIAFCILIIVEVALFRSWTEYDTDINNNPSTFMIRIGIALLPELVSIILTHTLFHFGKFHPVYALTQSIILFGLYLSCLMLNLIVVASDETSFDHTDTWHNICYGEVALQGVLALFWIVLGVFSCIAVHKWRREKAEAKMMEELEMEGQKVGSGNFNAKGVERPRVFV